jgi:hypothetical protein
VEPIRCERGHYYDPSKNSRCPFCGVQDLEVGKTEPKRPDAPKQGGGGDAQTQPKDRPRDAEPGKTVPLGKKELGIDPVVGWLVCVEGPDRGRDYRLHAEKNYIGRSEQMDICIASDDAVSRDDHAAVSYDPVNGAFKVHPGKARGLVYLNQAAVDIPTTLKTNDRIKLGATSLLFVPLCGDSFKWK